MKTITVLIPAYNEEAVLPQLFGAAEQRAGIPPLTFVHDKLPEKDRKSVV